jgi:hypothetical protein
MKIFQHIPGVLWSGVKHGCYFVAGAFLALSLAFIPYGGVFMALYLSGILVLLFPVGFIFGVLAYRPGYVKEKRKAAAPRKRRGLLIIAGLLLLTTISWFTGKYQYGLVEDEVIYQAAWSTGDDPLCESQVVVLTLVEYDTKETICSPQLMDYLKAQHKETIPVTYTTFAQGGKINSFHILNVGSFAVYWNDWIDSKSGCIRDDDELAYFYNDCGLQPHNDRTDHREHLKADMRSTPED